MTRKSFSRYMMDTAPLIGLSYSHHIDIGAGRLARGFTGIAIARD